MKRFLYTALAAFIVLTASIGALAELKGYSYPFIGKWMPSEHPMLVDDYGYQDIQNLRKEGKHLRGVLGHSSLNATSLSSYPVILNGFHFRKDQPQESHVIVYAANSFTPSSALLYRNTTAIPGTGNFTTTALYTNATVTDIGKFSPAPQGNMVYANGDVTHIWGGNEIEPTMFVTSSASVTYTISDPIDYTTAVRNLSSASDNVAVIAASTVDSYTKLLLHFDGADASTTFVDEAAHVITGRGTASGLGAQIDTAQYKWTSSLLLDGTDDYIDTPDSDDWALGTGDFTFEFWVRFNSVASSAGFFQQFVDNDNRVTFLWNQSTNSIIFQSYDTAAVKANYSWSWTPVANKWYHVGVMRSGTTMLCAIDGTYLTKTETTAIAANSLPNLAAATFQIGHTNYSASQQYLNGWMEEFRYSKGVARSPGIPPASPYNVKSNTWLVGYTRPIQGIKYYVSSANVTASTMTMKVWGGASWDAQTITDGTASGGKSLAQTGSVTWAYVENQAYPRYFNGLSLYWYQFSLDAGEASVYYVTVDAPIQNIRNVWDGGYDKPAAVLKYDGATYLTYTDEVVDEDSTSTYLDVSGLTTSQYIIAGFVQRQQAIDIQMVVTSENSTASTTMTPQYWSGNAWTNLSASNDGTATGTASLSKSGVVTWMGNGAGTERQRAISDESPLYYYKISFGATLDADTKIGEIRGIPYPENIPAYKIPVEFQNRVFLCNEKNQDKNKCIYSVANSPDIFNGTDSSYLTFGDKTEITAAAVVYNVFRTTGYDQLIIAKKNETYRITGDSPENWISQKMSGNIGCVAPLSMVTTESVKMSEDMYRNVAIWVSDKGVVASDGATINYISDDIKHYWDATNSAFIPVGMQSRSVGWYDPLLNSYKLLVASGASATYLNTELEYNLKTKEWTKLYRTNTAGANPIQSGWQVFDTNGLGYTYGGGKDGFMYRLENGYTFAGSPIQQYVQTKDILLGGDMLLNTTPTYFRLAFKTKTATAGEEINIAHYGDAVLTTSGSNGQYVPAAMSMASGPYRTSDCVLGPHQMHAFKITATTSTVYNGMELLGMSLFYDPAKTISQ